MAVNKEKPCVEIFGLVWENITSGVWQAKATCISMKVRILTNGSFTCSLGTNNEGEEYFTMAEACNAATLEMVKYLESHLETLRASLNLAKLL